MKKIYFSVLCCLLALISCQKDMDLPQNPEGNTPGEEEVEVLPETGNLVSSSLVSSVSAVTAYREAKAKIREMAEDILDLDLIDFDALLSNSFLYEGMELQTYRIVYTSLGGKNGREPVTLSADVALINSVGAKVPRVIESINFFSPSFNTDEESTVLFESMIFPIRTLYNTIVINPHFQGVCEDKGKHTITVTESMMKARQGIDCIKATMEFAKKLKNVYLMDGYYSEIMGASNGGANVLAMQYLLENDTELKVVNRDIVHLRGTYCCDGCYGYKEVLSSMKISDEDFVISDTDNFFSDVSSVMNSGSLVPDALFASIISAYDTYSDSYFKDIQLESFFSDVFKAIRVDGEGKDMGLIELYRSGNYSMLEYFTGTGISPSDMFAEGVVVNGHFNPEDYRVKALFSALENDLRYVSDWSPVTPLTIAHSVDDDFIPYEQASSLYGNISNSGRNRNVSFKTINGMTHLPATFYFLISDILFKEHPCPLN